jgi:hypothetical protein
VTSGRRPHVVIVNRWRERYAEYERYIDHHDHRVTYVTTEVGAGAVPATAAAVEVVERTDDLARLRAAVQDLATRFGSPAEIIALKEDDLLPIARLREEWGCPGQRPHDLTPVLDKYEMYRLVEAADIPLPPFELFSGAEGVLAFGERYGWPVIVKPRIGGASEDVVVAVDPVNVLAVDPAEHELLVQAFDSRTVYHTDGLFADGELVFCRASRYVNTCLTFRHGSFLGSVEEDDPRLNRALADVTLKCLRALVHGSTVFHLELFVDASGRDEPSVAFLELGARPGGGENTLVWREVHGIDLVEIAFRLHRGLSPFAGRRPEPRDDVITGQVYIPSPLPRPCRITEVAPETMLGRPNGPYAEWVPNPGEILPDAVSYYEHVGGRFRFCGESTQEVEDAILDVVSSYHVAAEPLHAHEAVA